MIQNEVGSNWRTIIQSYPHGKGLEAEDSWMGCSWKVAEAMGVLL